MNRNDLDDFLQKIENASFALFKVYSESFGRILFYGTFDTSNSNCLLITAMVRKTPIAEVSSIPLIYVKDESLYLCHIPLDIEYCFITICIVSSYYMQYPITVDNVIIHRKGIFSNMTL